MPPQHLKDRKCQMSGPVFCVQMTVASKEIARCHGSLLAVHASLLARCRGDSATWTQKSISMLLHAAARTIFASVAPRLLGGHELIGATVLGTNRPGV
ncbi:hypothetical protein HYQ44_002079 [Verticillium longisporum]|nr:hypothetical protein HYQ44_002079 [Verticillium longisporum]